MLEDTILHGAPQIFFLPVLISSLNVVLFSEMLCFYCFVDND